MTFTLARRTTAVAALAVTAVGGAALTTGAGQAFAAGSTHTSLSVRAAKSAIRHGGHDTVGGDLRVGHGLDASGRTVLLEARARGAKTFHEAGSATTGAHGAVSFRISPDATTRYKLVFAGDEADAASHSAVATVRVGPAVHRSSTSLSIGRATRSVSPGTSDVISGRLRHRGHGLAGRTVVLQDRSTASTAVFVDDGTAKTGAHGRVRFTVTPAAATAYRLVFTGGTRYQPAHSRAVVVHVRQAGLTLTLGSRSIQPGAGDTVTGVYTDKGAAVAGETVDLRARAVGSHSAAFHQVATGTTGTDGSVTFPVSPTTATRYVLVAPRTTTDSYARSRVATVHILRPTSLSIRATRTTVASGAKAVISGQLLGGGKALDARKVTLQERATGTTTWTAVTAKRTAKAGRVRFATVPPTASEDYQLVYAGSVNHDGCQSGVVTVTVS